MQLYSFPYCCSSCDTLFKRYYEKCPTCYKENTLVNYQITPEQESEAAKTAVINQIIKNNEKEEKNKNE